MGLKMNNARISKRKLLVFYEKSGQVDLEPLYRGRDVKRSWLYVMRAFWLRKFIQKLFIGGVILDVGCGEGSLLKRIFRGEASPFIVGVDIAVSALRKAKSKICRGNFIQADAHYLPLRQRAFSIVICSEVLEHVLNPYKVIFELHRVTKKYVLVSTPTQMSSWLARLLMLIDRRRYKPDYDLKRHGHINFFMVKGLISYFNNYFVVQELRGIGIFMLHYETLGFIPAPILRKMMLLNFYLDILLSSLKPLNIIGNTTIFLLKEKNIKQHLFSSGIH